MALFSTSYHLAGLRGLPRRIYSGSFEGEAAAARWQPLTTIGAWGGTVLFLSALAFVAVVIATWVSGRRIEAPAFEFARPLQPAGAPGIGDRLGTWTVVAVILIAVAYAYPLAHLLSLQRFGSPPYQPF